MMSSALMSIIINTLILHLWKSAGVVAVLISVLQALYRSRVEITALQGIQYCMSRARRSSNQYEF